MSTPNRQPRPGAGEGPGQDDPAGRLEAAWSGIALLLALLLLGVQLPWALLAAVPALVGLVLAVVVVRRRLRARQRAGAAWAGIGVVLGLYVAGLCLLQAVLYGPADAHRRCTATAATDVARAACDARLDDDLGDLWVTLLD